MDQMQIIDWLLEGDVSIQYQVYRDLYGVERPELQARISAEGWGRLFLSFQKDDGHWGKKFYEPKWTSSHYTLMDLRNLCISPGNEKIKDVINTIVEEEKAPDGGIKPIGTSQISDACINGMFLNYASYFNINKEHLQSVIDCILNGWMKDGGFNCRFNRSGARHSSMHTTISVLEGLTEYLKNGYTYRSDDVKKAIVSSVNFLLIHQLYISDRTGKIINEQFLKLSYPSRWKYDILRAFDYFQYAGIPWDDRMQSAMEVIMKKQRKDGRWNVQARHPGKVHFNMESAGQASRWNTLRVLRVLKHYNIELAN
jgi:hypothetical protein